MPSDSGASSLGHTGRPSMWTGSGQRKLSRLYTYTRLSFEQMQRVLSAVVFGDGDCPGKDSINKKLSSNFDKEPRWLRPKTDTDMDRRLEQLANSPTRRQAPDLFRSGHSRAASSSVSSHNTLDQMIKDEYATTPNINDFQMVDGVAPTYWSNPLMPLPALTSTHVAFGAGWDAGEPLTAPAPPFYSAEGLLRRSTIMTNSTDMTYTAVQQALADCPEGLVKKINKLMKRFTIPMATHNENEDSPYESRPGTPDLSASAWNGDEDEERLPDDDRPLPGDFLRLDLELEAEGRCLGEDSPDHQTRSCYCDARDAITQDHWVSEYGVSPDLNGVLFSGLNAVTDSSIRDPYGNSLLHLLAARNASPQVLERAINDATNLSATNSGEQTFLHLLGTSWLTAPTLLVHLLQKLDRDGFDIYARDVYGKSVFHILEDKTEDLQRPNVESILRHFQRDKYYQRDAFGCFPGRNLQAPPVLRLDTSFVTPPPQLDGQAAESDNYTHQARLLQFIRESHEDPTREDHKGRNGLHCLADVILSEDTLKAQYGSIPTAGPSTHSPGNNNRKRKFHTPYTNKEVCDSSKERLNLRLRLVNSLLQAGVDPNHYAIDGTTPLMAFILHLPEDGDYKVPPAIIQQLIQGGANVNARNRKGETALHVAARSGRKLAVRILVQNGANVHARDASGRGVLDVLDAKVMGTRKDQKANAHYEACRAWLSGKEGMAVQNPTVMNEWGWRERI